MRYINNRYRRIRTLWEGGYSSSLEDRETCLPHCYRSIELNPVRARMTADPFDYGWSIRGLNAFGSADPPNLPHAAYLALGSTDDERHRAQRTLAMENLSHDHLNAIRAHLQRQHALGSDRFSTAIEARLSRRARPPKIRRPKKVHPEKPTLKRGP